MEIADFRAGLQSLQRGGDILYYSLLFFDAESANTFHTIYTSGITIYQSMVELTKLISWGKRLGLSNIAMLSAGLTSFTSIIGGVYALYQLSSSINTPSVMEQLQKLGKYIEDFRNEMRARLVNIESMLTQETQIVLAVLRLDENILQKIELLQNNLNDMYNTVLSGFTDVQNLNYLQRAGEILDNARVSTSQESLDSLTEQQYDGLNEPIAFFGTWANQIATTSFSTLYPIELSPSEEINLFSIELQQGNIIVREQDFNRYLNYIRTQARLLDQDGFQNFPSLAHPLVWQKAVTDLVRYMDLVKHLLNRREDRASLNKYVQSHTYYLEILEKGRSLLLFNKQVRQRSVLFKKLMESVDNAFQGVAVALNVEWQKHKLSRFEYHDGRKANCEDAGEYISELDSFICGKSEVPAEFVPGFLRKYKVFIFNRNGIAWDGERFDPPYDGGLQSVDYDRGPDIFEKFYEGIEKEGKDKHLEMNGNVLLTPDAINPFGTASRTTLQHGVAWQEIAIALEIRNNLQKIYSGVRKKVIQDYDLLSDYLSECIEMY